jgi:hypothetical protein
MTIESLQSKLDEQKYLLDILDMWEKVKAQGIDPEEVKCFALLPEFMSRLQKRKWNALEYAKDPNRRVNGCNIVEPTHANAVRMKDGTTNQLDPWVELP